VNWLKRTAAFFVFILLASAALLTVISFVAWSVEPFQMVMRSEGNAWGAVRVMLVLSALFSSLFTAWEEEKS
jgi:hypothetical protein